MQSPVFLFLPMLLNFFCEVEASPFLSPVVALHNNLPASSHSFLRVWFPGEGGGAGGGHSKTDYYIECGIVELAPDKDPENLGSRPSFLTNLKWKGVFLLLFSDVHVLTGKDLQVIC